jgi:hypothetical protein
VADAEHVAQLAQIVLQSLAAGKAVEIDGLGSFYPDPTLGCRFEPRVQVFVAYVREDREQAEQLYDALYDGGFNPWMDVRNLVPGQNWPRAIENAIETADFFVACFSKFSVTKKGGFQAEIRYALDCARRLPLDQIFVVPVRLNECHVPRSIQKDIQYVDLFPDWDDGVRGVSKMMRGEVRRWRPAA